MKKNVILKTLAFMLIATLFCGCSKSENSKLVGTWKSVRKNDVTDITHTYTFTNSGTYTWRQHGKQKPYSSSPWITIDDKESGTYAYDASSKTIAFSVAEYNGSAYSNTYLCYVQTLSDNTLVLIKNYQNGPVTETFTKQ